MTRIVDQQIDRTNVALILADTYDRLHQYYGQRAGLAPEAELAWEAVVSATAGVLAVSIEEARAALDAISDQRSNDRIGDRGTMYRLAGGCVADSTRGDRPGAIRVESQTEEARRDEMDAWTKSFCDKIDEINRDVQSVYDAATYNSFIQEKLRQIQRRLILLKDHFTHE